MYIKVLVDNYKLLTKVYTPVFCDAGANASYQHLKKKILLI